MGGQAGASDDLNTIRTFEQGWDAAAMRGDDSYTLARVAPDYTGISPDGHVMDRAGLLADLAHGRQTLRDYHPDREPDIYFYGDTAIVHGHDVLVSKAGRTFHNVFTDTWVRRDGQWKVISTMDASQP